MWGRLAEALARRRLACRYLIHDGIGFFTPTGVGTQIAEAFEKVGKDGVITVEESQTFGIELEFVEGMQFDKGYISPYFVTDAERMEASLDDPYILLVSSKISSVRDLVPATIPIPFRRVHAAICGKTISGDTAREYFE